MFEATLKDNGRILKAESLSLILHKLSERFGNQGYRVTPSGDIVRTGGYLLGRIRFIEVIAIN